MAEKYLILMSTIMVATQVIRITQNAIQLAIQNRAVKRELDRIGTITDEDIVTQKRFFKLATEYLDKQKRESLDE